MTSRGLTRPTMVTSPRQMAVADNQPDLAFMCGHHSVAAGQRARRSSAGAGSARRHRLPPTQANLKNDVGMSWKWSKTLTDRWPRDSLRTPIESMRRPGRRLILRSMFCRHRPSTCRRPSPESIADEISEAAARAEPGPGAGEGAGGRGPLGGDSGRPEPVAGSGGVGVQPGEERPGGSRAAAEGRALGAKPGTGRSDDDVAGPSKSARPAPLPATVFGPDDTGIVDKAAAKTKTPRRSAAPPGAERVDCQGHSFLRLAMIKA